MSITQLVVLWTVLLFSATILCWIWFKNGIASVNATEIKKKDRLKKENRKEVMSSDSSSESSESGGSTVTCNDSHDGLWSFDIEEEERDSDSQNSGRKEMKGNGIIMICYCKLCTKNVYLDD